MTLLTISPLNSANDLSEINVSDQECVNGGFFLSLSNGGNTKLVRETILQNIAYAPNQNQVVATSGSTVLINSTIPSPTFPPAPVAPAL